MLCCFSLTTLFLSTLLKYIFHGLLCREPKQKLKIFSHLYFIALLSSKCSRVENKIRHEGDLGISQVGSCCSIPADSRRIRSIVRKNFLLLQSWPRWINIPIEPKISDMWSLAELVNILSLSLPRPLFALPLSRVFPWCKPLCQPLLPSLHLLFPHPVTAGL